MKIKSKWVTAPLRLRRAAAMASVVGLTAGGIVLAAGSAALAAHGSEPGNLTVNPPGTQAAPVPLTTLLSFSTSDACPANFQGSAVLGEFNTDGSFATDISQVQQPASAPFTNVLVTSGGTQLDMATALSGTNITPGGTVEWAVQCWSGAGASGNNEYVQSTFVTETADGNNYFTSASGPAAITTTTTLTASPNPATVGATETLTATEVAADTTHPAGNVQFEAGGTDIGSPVAVNTSGVATLSTTAVTAVAGTQNLTAVFTPTSASYSGSTSAPVSLQVNCVTNCSINAGGTNPVSISVTVPSTGALSVTVAAGTVSLAVQGSTPPLTATGTLNQVTVQDTRNTVPGWSVSGQITQPFTGSGSAAGATFSGDQLGWVPAAVGSLVGGAVLGPTVAAGTNPGLQDAPQVLVSAAPGSGTGTNVVDAGLTLDIPTSAIAGPYTAMLTVTYLSTGP
jgi:Bacterial Ig-like domain (group 3)